jgi:hypothetical protein
MSKEIITDEERYKMECTFGCALNEKIGIIAKKMAGFASMEEFLLAAGETLYLLYRSFQNALEVEHCLYKENKIRPFVRMRPEQFGPLPDINVTNDKQMLEEICRLFVRRGITPPPWYKKETS